MAQWVKVPATKADNLGSIPWTHMVEGEILLLCWGCPHTRIPTHNLLKHNKIKNRYPESKVMEIICLYCHFSYDMYVQCCLLSCQKNKILSFTEQVNGTGDQRVK